MQAAPKKIFEFLILAVIGWALFSSVSLTGQKLHIVNLAGQMPLNLFTALKIRRVNPSAFPAAATLRLNCLN